MRAAYHFLLAEWRNIALPGLSAQQIQYST